MRLVANQSFIPTLMAIIAIVVFAEFLIGFEREPLTDYQKLRTISYAGDIAGARLLLSSMASSAIIVANVAIIITIVVVVRAYFLPVEIS